MCSGMHCLNGFCVKIVGRARPLPPNATCFAMSSMEEQALYGEGHLWGRTSPMRGTSSMGGGHLCGRRHLWRKTSSMGGNVIYGGRRHLWGKRHLWGGNVTYGVKRHLWRKTSSMRGTSSIGGTSSMGKGIYGDGRHLWGLSSIKGRHPAIADIYGDAGAGEGRNINGLPIDDRPRHLRRRRMQKNSLER
jgi:hypothetical protein